MKVLTVYLRRERASRTPLANAPLDTGRIKRYSS
jgi:hypothetical protein